jgi:hypothetical protein
MRHVRPSVEIWHRSGFVSGVALVQPTITASRHAEIHLNEKNSKAPPEKSKT